MQSAICLGVVCLAVGIATPNLTAAKPQAPATTVDLIRVEPKTGWNKYLGRTLFRVRFPDGRDVAYDLGHFPEGSWSIMPFVLGRPLGRYSSYKYNELSRDLLEDNASLHGQRLDLPPGVSENLTLQLEQMTGTQQSYQLDPMRDTGSSRAAQLLDKSLNGSLSRQASLPVLGDRRGWILEKLKSYPGAWLVADLFVRPIDQKTLVAWDTTFMPSGLEKVIDRASFNGQPLVIDRYLEGQPLDARGGTGFALWVFMLPVALLARWRPRVVSVMGGAIVGGLGVAGVVLTLGPSWEGIGDIWYIALLPPTHLLLVGLALSNSLWWSSLSSRIIYAYLSFVVAMGYTLTSLLGWVPAMPPCALVVGVSLSLGLALGFRMERRAAHLRRGTAQDVRPRATSFIERHSSYIRPGGVRLR